MLWIRGGRKKELERLEALERAQEGLDSRLRLIKIEWESVLHKVNGVMGRLNARIRKNEAQEEPEGPGPEIHQTPPAAGSHAVLAHMRSKRGLLPR